jgi:hypothetical protein
MTDKLSFEPGGRLGSQRLSSRSGCLSSLSFQLSSASGVLALALAASIVPVDPALAGCAATGVSNGTTTVVCSGDGATNATSDTYYAAPNTQTSVEVRTGTEMTTAGAAVRVRGGSSITVSSGATVTVTGNEATEAFNALYAGGNGSTLTNNGTISTIQNSVDGLEATGNGNTLVNTGRVSTQGNSSEGLIARGDNNSLRNSGTIQTSGESARGLIAEGHNNTLVNERTGVISTTNRGGEGIRADGGRPNGPGTDPVVGRNATILNQGTITTTGFTADGIRLIGEQGRITNEGTITARGQDGRGIKLQGTGNQVENRGTIRGEGQNGDGAIILSTAGQTNTVINRAGGSIISVQGSGIRDQWRSRIRDCRELRPHPYGGRRWNCRQSRRRKRLTPDWSEFHNRRAGAGRHRYGYVQAWWLDERNLRRSRDRRDRQVPRIRAVREGRHVHLDRQERQ